MTFFGDPTLAGGIVDPLAHNACKLDPWLYVIRWPLPYVVALRVGGAVLDAFGSAVRLDVSRAPAAGRVLVRVTA